MKRPWALPAIFVAGIVLGGAVVFAVADNDSGSTNVDTKNGQGDNTTGSATSNELLDRLAKGEQATYHVRYTTGDVSRAHAILEVWHGPDRVRRDLRVTGSTGESTQTREFLNDGKFVRCALIADNPWQCVAAPASQANLQDPLGGAGAGVTGRDMTVTDDTVAGHAVKCYTAEAANSSAKPVKFCLSKEHVPLLIDGGDGKETTATNYDFDVPDSVFKYPAQVAGLNSSST